MGMNKDGEFILIYSLIVRLYAQIIDMKHFVK